MTRTARGLVTGLTLTLALLAGGCGGDDEDSKASDTPSSEAPTPTKDEFVQQADAICAAGNEELSTAADALGEAPTQEEIEGFASDTMVPNLQGQHDDIEALGAPEGDEDDVQAILDALQTGIDALTADPSLITSSDDPLADATDLAQTYGLQECGS
jgi:hypothetical protein